MQIGKSPTAYVCDVSGLSQRALIKHLQDIFFEKAVNYFCKKLRLKCQIKACYTTDLHSEFNPP